MPAIKYYNTDTSQWEQLPLTADSSDPRIGDLGDLDTADQTSVVAAINEIAGAVPTVTIEGAIGASFTAPGGTITPGFKAYVSVPYACVINSATILSMDGASGSIVVDIWKAPFADFPPTDADSITGGNEAAMTGIKSADAVLTGWDTDIDDGDVLGFNVDSVTDLSSVVITLKVTKI